MAFQNVLKAVAQTVLDAKVSVVDDLLAFLGTKVEVDDDVKAIFAEFKGTLKVEKVTAPKKGKASKKSSDDEEEPKKKRVASIFNLYVKDMMPVLKEKHPEVKNGKELMTLASESWKTDPLGIFVKEKAVGLKKANPEWDNVELYKRAKAAFTAGSDASDAEVEDGEQEEPKVPVRGKKTAAKNAAKAANAANAKAKKAPKKTPTKKVVPVSDDEAEAESDEEIPPPESD
jgi:hypothetical protein